MSGLFHPVPLTLPCVSFSLPDNGYRECLANGSWAARVNYSQCQEILSEEVHAHRPFKLARPVLWNWEKGSKEEEEEVKV